MIGVCVCMHLVCVCVSVCLFIVCGSVCEQVVAVDCVCMCLCVLQVVVFKVVAAVLFVSVVACVLHLCMCLAFVVACVLHLVAVLQANVLFYSSGSSHDSRLTRCCHASLCFAGLLCLAVRSMTETARGKWNSYVKLASSSCSIRWLTW